MNRAVVSTGLIAREDDGLTLTEKRLNMSSVTMVFHVVSSFNSLV